MASVTPLFAGIDIGSTSVRIAVGQRLPQGDKEVLHIMGAAEVPSEGINRGQIKSIEDAVSSISTCLERVEKMTGAQVTHAWVSLGGSHVTMLESRGVVAVSKADGEIRDDDVERVVEAAQNIPPNNNYETVHVIPRVFVVDGQGGINDPVGMNGIRLEVDCQIVQGASVHLKNLRKCVYRTGVNIESVAVGILASAEVTVTPRQKDLGVAVIDIGAAATTIAVFEQGHILHLASVPIGSEHLTSDIAIGLRTSIDVAERVKLQHASANVRDCGKDEVINLRDLGAQDDEEVSRHYVCEIVEARLEELMERLDKELKKVSRSGLLPAGVVFVGGGAKLPGLVDLAKRRLRLPAGVGQPSGVTGITDRVNDSAFATAIGLVQWWVSEVPEEPTRRGGGFGLPGVKGVGDTVKKWFSRG
jgi:cell division protein FtsA